MVNANDLKKRAMIVIEGEPYQVTDVAISLPSARGASMMVRVKARHIINGTMLDKNFKAADKFQEADIDKIGAAFNYKDENTYYFMNQSTYETIELSKAVVADAAAYLIEEQAVKVITYQGAPVALELPLFVNLKVVETEPVSQQAGGGGGGIKNAILETGLEVKVAKHIASGETVRVNTETGEVGGRA
ncbi:MAG: elongation factor P [Candidatus Omnitrophica bacterium]|nr:elongation factor P [Candidatus Omnitrophota bacterium]